MDVQTPSTSSVSSGFTIRETDVRIAAILDSALDCARRNDGHGASFAFSIPSEPIVDGAQPRRKS